MAAASTVVDLCALADAKLDAATSAKFFRDDDDDDDEDGGAISSCSWPEAERTTSKLVSQCALQVLCGKYKVPAGYTPTTLDGRWVACRPPPEGSNIVFVYADALEAGMRIPLHKFYVAVLRHFGLAPTQLAPHAWRHMAAFVLLSKDAGVKPSLQAFLSLFSLCTHDGDSVGWHHFESRPGRYLLSRKMPKSPEWKSRFFFLRLPTTGPWPCPVKWGKPSRAAVRMPVVTADTDMVIKKLMDTAGSSGIDVVQFLSRRTPPVAPLQLRLNLVPQQKHRLGEVEAAAAAAGAGRPPQQLQHGEPTRKRKSFSDDTQARGLVECIAESSELAKKAMAELDDKGKELLATRGEVTKLKEALSIVNAHREASIEEVKAECASAVTKLQEEHAAVVTRLKEHVADARQVAEEHRKAAELAAEHHKAEVAKLRGDHAAAAARLKEEHAADVARVKDAADKEVQDTKKKIVLRLFPKLDVSLLENQGTPLKRGERSMKD